MTSGATPAAHDDLLGTAAPLSGDFDSIFDDDEDPMAPVVSSPSLSDHGSLNPLLGNHAGSNGLGIDDGLGLGDGSSSAESVLSAPQQQQQQRSSMVGSRRSSSISAAAPAPHPMMAGSSGPESAMQAGLGDRSSSVGSNGRRRGSSSTVPEDMTTAGWQNDEKDKDFRKQLIYQIANLLRERKTDPSDKWLKELPFKARKLEEQLYKKAPSLKAYLDPGTLKTRLKKVAHAITSQFREARDAKNKTGPVGGGSRRTSGVDIGNHGARGSISSIGSLSSASDLTGGLGGGGAGGFDQPQQQQQAQVNASLQEQMFENIRQQQRIYDNLLQTNPQLAQMAGFSQDQLLQARLQGMMGQSATATTAGAMNGMASLGQMNPAAAAAAAAGGMQNPLAAQAALMQSAGLGGAMAQNSLSAANQMAMMNQQALLRNSFTGTSGLSAMQAAMLGQSSTTGGTGGAGGLASMIPPPPLAGLNASSAPGINPSMPPPSAGKSRTSSFVAAGAAHQLANAGGTQSRSASFTAPGNSIPSRGNSFSSNNGSGGAANGVNNGTSGVGNNNNRNASRPRSLSNEDLSLSPNSFKW